MGIRPTMYAVVGITDFTFEDERFTKEFDFDYFEHEDELEIPEPVDDKYKIKYVSLRDWTKKEAPMKTFQQSLYVGNLEFTATGILGLKIGEVETNNVLYTLAAIFEEFQIDGHKVVPPIENAFMRGRHSKLNNITEEQVVSFFSSDMKEYINSAQYLLNCINFNVNKEDLRLLLVWNWG